MKANRDMVGVLLWRYENARSLIHVSRRGAKISDLIGRYRFFLLLTRFINDTLRNKGGVLLMNGYSEGLYLFSSREKLRRAKRTIGAMSTTLSSALGFRIDCSASYVSSRPQSVAKAYRRTLRGASSKRVFREHFTVSRQSSQSSFSSISTHRYSEFKKLVASPAEPITLSQIHTLLERKATTGPSFASLHRRNFCWFRADISGLGRHNTLRLERGAQPFLQWTLRVSTLFQKIQAAISRHSTLRRGELYLLHCHADDVIMIVSPRSLNTIQRLLENAAAREKLNFNIAYARIRGSDTPASVARRVLRGLNKKKGICNDA